MSFYFFNVLLKLNISLLLILHYYVIVFAVFIERVDIKMAFQSLFARKKHNTNYNCLYKSDPEETQIVCSNKKARVIQAGGLLVTIHNDIKEGASVDNPSPSSIYNNYLKSCVRYGVANQNSFQIGDLFSKEFLKQLFVADKTKGIMKQDSLKSELTYSMQKTSNSHSNNSSVKGDLKVEYKGNKNWATWKTQSQISTERLSKVEYPVKENNAEKAYISAKSALHLNQSIMPSKQSFSKFFPPITVADVENSKLENIEDKFENMVSWITEEDCDSHNKYILPALSFETKLPVTPEDLDKVLSKLPIAQDSNLETNLNGLQNSSNANFAFNSPPFWKGDHIFSPVYKPRENNYVYDDYPCITSLKKNEKIELKRCRSDSGISLDSNFEGNSSPEPYEPKLDSEEGSSFSDSSDSEVSQKSMPEKNGKLSARYDDCTKVCCLCKNVILNQLFLACRIGLLLNCLHSFCYPCIQIHCESLSLQNGKMPVKCPECGEPSPGIVSSPRWIEDMKEKIALFQKVEEATESFLEKRASTY